MRAVLISLLLLLASRTAATAQPEPLSAARVHSEYDAARNRTVLHLDRVALDSGVSLSALASFAGRTLGVPDAKSVILTFWFTESVGISAEAQTALSVNGSPPAPVGPAYPVAGPRRGFLEVRMTAVGMDRWKELVEAESAILAVGRHTFALSDEVLNALREFGNRMSSQPPERS